MKMNLSRPITFLYSPMLLLFGYIGFLFAQPPQEWASRYDGAMHNRDIAGAIAVDQDGNVYITGISRENSNYGHMTTIKYGPNGNLEWIDSYAPSGGGGNVNTGVAISIQAPALGGNIFVGGTVTTLEGDFAVAKYTPDGVRQWIKTYSGLFLGGADYCVDVAADPLGGVYAFGAVNLGNGSFLDLATVRFDATGNLLWERNYSGASSTTDIPRAMAVDDSGRTYVVAKTYAFWGSASFDYTTICYLPDGTEQWVVEYNGPAQGEDQPVDIVCDKFQNQYITGYVTGSNGTLDFGTIMQNFYGTRLWAATYNGSANGADSAIAVTLDPAGNVYITGLSMELHNGNPVQAVTTISYDPQGNQRWIQYYFGEDELGAIPAGIRVDNFGGVYVAGSSITFGQPGGDYMVVKYDTAGAQQWIVTYGGPGNNNDEPHALMLDDRANIYITGGSFGSGTQMDYATIRYTQNLTGISDRVNNQPGAFTLHQNYPNPFNPSTTIHFTLPQAGTVRLSVFNVLGQKVTEPINTRLSAGVHEIVWEAGLLPSGIYLYQLEFAGKSNVKRMVLLR